MIGAALVWAFLAVPSASALVITTADDSSDADSETGADTYVQNDAPDTNFGGNNTVITKHKNAGAPGNKDRITVLKFDTADAPTPGGASDVTLTMEHTSTNGSGDQGFTLYGIPEASAEEDFGESALKFNNFDYASTTADGSLDPSGASGASDDLILLKEFTVSGLGVFDVSSTELATFVGNDTNGLTSFVLFERTTKGFSAFGSKETTSGATFPTLTVNPIPEPGSLALVGLGGLGLLSRRRRRRV